MSEASEEKSQLELELMKVQIDHGRLDMKRIEQEMRWETWKALAIILGGVAAVSGVILGVAHLIK